MGNQAIQLHDFSDAIRRVAAGELSIRGESRGTDQHASAKIEPVSHAKGFVKIGVWGDGLFQFAKRGIAEAHAREMLSLMKFPAEEFLWFEDNEDAGDWIPKEKHVAPESRRSRVYFIQSGDSGPIKIGVSVSVDTRLKNIQVYHPLPLRVIGLIEGTVKKEHEVHTLFAKHRLRGEWFSPSPEILAFIKENSEGTCL